MRNVLILLFVFYLPCLAGAQENPNDFKDWMKEFRLRTHTPSISYAVIKNKQVLISEALGWSDDEGDVSSTLDTTYFIASVTKPMAGIAFLRAADAGLINLDEPLLKTAGWAGFCEWFASSGIVFAGNQELGIPQMDCSAKPSLQNSLNMQVNGVPGTTFVYNPVVFARLGRVFPETGEDSFKAMLRRFVIEPAGMKTAAAGWHDLDASIALTLLAPPFAVGDDGDPVKQAFPDDDIRAAAGIYASINDMIAFDQAISSDILLTNEQKQRLWTPPLDGNGKPSVYSNGWFVQEYRGTTLLWHSGWEPDKYSAIYLRLPEQKLTLIALANTEALWWGNSLSAAEIEKSEVVQAFFKAYVPELAKR